MDEANKNILRWLETAGDLTEVAHTTTFTGRRGHRLVTVVIHDRGPNAPAPLRYHATAQTEDGATATGNPAESIQTVLATLHWDKLDR